MIRHAIVLALLLVLAGPAGAQQQQRIYGPDGKSLGTVTRDSQGSARFYEARGKSLGTSSTDSAGTTTFYDSRGRVIGRTR
jgi:hypothetical protein